MSDNTYAPTAKPPGGFKSGQVFDISDADAVRRQHLNHEASIRGIGWLYLLGGVSGSLGGLAYGTIGIGGVLGAVPVAFRQRGIYLFSTIQRDHRCYALHQLPIRYRVGVCGIGRGSDCLDGARFPDPTNWNFVVTVREISNSLGV